MAPSAEEQAKVNSALKDLNLTPEVRVCGVAVRAQAERRTGRAPIPACLQETSKFSKAFKDPEFIKMFAEYAKEVSDPAVSFRGAWAARSCTPPGARGGCCCAAVLLWCCWCALGAWQGRWAASRARAGPRRRAHARACACHMPRLPPACPAQVKEETDAYLRQLEAEGRGEEVYGKDTQLIVPDAAFVVKSVEASTGLKGYINICTSKKVRVLRQRASAVRGSSGGCALGRGAAAARSMWQRGVDRWQAGGAGLRMLCAQQRGTRSTHRQATACLARTGACSLSLSCSRVCKGAPCPLWATAGGASPTAATAHCGHPSKQTSLN